LTSRNKSAPNRPRPAPKLNMIKAKWRRLSKKALKVARLRKGFTNAIDKFRIFKRAFLALERKYLEFKGRKEDQILIGGDKMESILQIEDFLNHDIHSPARTQNKDTFSRYLIMKVHLFLLFIQSLD
jgi:hypothetical protein